MIKYALERKWLQLSFEPTAAILGIDFVPVHGEFQQNLIALSKFVRKYPGCTKMNFIENFRANALGSKDVIIIFSTILI
jgi:hypothetical protein